MSIEKLSKGLLSTEARNRRQPSGYDANRMRCGLLDNSPVKRPQRFLIGPGTCIFMMLGALAAVWLGANLVSIGLPGWQYAVSSETYKVPVGVGACVVGVGVFVAASIQLLRIAERLWPSRGDEASTALFCRQCRYDLRVQAADGKCPECGTSVEESKRWAAIPRRPAWRDSDPRWRRRILLGTWVLVFLPLMDTLQSLGWAERVPMPDVIDHVASVQTLADTLLCDREDLYPPLIFCIGIVLLFAREHGRRPNQFDWTRKWGVLCSYVVLLLNLAWVLFVVALVMSGIAALFLAMPLAYQPKVTTLLVKLSDFYLRYGLSPNQYAVAVRTAFSSVAVLFACPPLFAALRSTRMKHYVLIPIIALCVCALLNLFHAGVYALRLPTLSWRENLGCQVFFQPDLLVQFFVRAPNAINLSVDTLVAGLAEVVKWSVILAIAIWLSIAQIRASLPLKRQGRLPDCAT